MARGLQSAKRCLFCAAATSLEPRAFVSLLSSKTIYSATRRTQKWTAQYTGSFPALSQSSRPNYFSTTTVLNQGNIDNDGPLHAAYYDMIQNQGMMEDPIQLKALRSLERLRRELKATKPPTKITDPSQTSKSESSQSSSSSWTSWFGGGGKEKTSSTPTNSNKPINNNLPRGCYLHGGVGCGKTMLMHLFYDSIDTSMQEWQDAKQKVHFHKFMLKVHSQMHQARQENNNKAESDSILPWVIADTLKHHGRLICFDEFQVTDVGDAMILQRLFTGLWEQGCVVVATSNRPPRDLYLGGLQRDRFIPFIDLLEEQCEVVSMKDSDVDYRMVISAKSEISSSQKVYFVGKEERQDFNALFYELAKGQSMRQTTIMTEDGGRRKVKIPQASLSLGIARFSFEDLCQKALGAADYLIVGQTFHTVFIEKIPKLKLAHINWVRRFITFIDSMYEQKVTVVFQAATPPGGIFTVDDATDAQDDEVFAFDRTRSRMEEMMSEQYLSRQWKNKDKSKKIIQQLRISPSLSEDLVEA